MNATANRPTHSEHVDRSAARLDDDRAARAHPLLTRRARRSNFSGRRLWQSGQTKLDGWRVSESALYLFKEDYKLPLLDPVVAAHLAAVMEHVFPACSFSGSRAGSRRPFFRNDSGDRSLCYPDAWPTHGVWATCFLLIVARGPALFLSTICWAAARVRREPTAQGGRPAIHQPASAHHSAVEICVTRPSANQRARKPAARSMRCSSPF